MRKAYRTLAQLLLVLVVVGSTVSLVSSSAGAIAAGFPVEIAPATENSIAGYFIGPFTVGAGPYLPGADYFTVTFPAGTTVPIAISRSLVSVSSSMQTMQTGSPAVDPVVVGQSARVYVPTTTLGGSGFPTINNGDSVWIRFSQAAGIRNPGTPGLYSLTVSGTYSVGTEAAATSAPYEIIATGFTPDQRDMIVEIADAYANHVWYPTINNSWHTTLGKGNLASKVETPDRDTNTKWPTWMGWKAGEANVGIPYAWGGDSSIRPFVVSGLKDFDSAIAAGLAAGNIPPNKDIRYSVGVDCAGLVQRAWQLPNKLRGDSKWGVWNLAAVSTPISNYTQMRRGDILILVDPNNNFGHVMLVGEDFVPARDPHSIWVYEASNRDWKVSRREFIITDIKDDPKRPGDKISLKPAAVPEDVPKGEKSKWQAASYIPYQFSRILYNQNNSGSDMGNQMRPFSTLGAGLYAGSSNPGVVYLGTSDWPATSLFQAPPKIVGCPNSYSGTYKVELSLGGIDESSAVLSLVRYKDKSDNWDSGHLYAGTCTSPYGGVGRVYRYDGDKEWFLVADHLDNQVSSLVVYNDMLYAGTAWRGGRLYEYNKYPFDWTKRVDYQGWSGFRSAYVWNVEDGGDGLLYLGDIGWDKIGRYDGVAFQYTAYLGGSCIYDFASYSGELYAAAYLGRMHKSSDGIHWTPVINTYQDGNMWELEVYQNDLYMSLNDGRLQRYAGTYDGVVIVEDKWFEPSGLGIISMTAANNELYLGVGGEFGYLGSSSGIGKVYSYNGVSNPVVISTHSLGTGVQVLCYITK